jgi:hypothetical protein
MLALMLELEERRTRTLIKVFLIVYAIGLSLSLLYSVNYWDISLFIIGLNSISYWLLIVFIFLSGFAWIPVCFFLLIKGISLKRLYKIQSYEGDRTTGNLALIFPLIFISIWIGTRIIY